MKRRRALFLFFALIAVVVLWAFWVEPYQLEVTRASVTAPVLRPITIAHLTDLHTRSFGRRERTVIEILRKERPDAIVVTGDTIRSNGTYHDVRTLLSQLHAPLGVWVVRGNWEHWRRPSALGASEGEAKLYASAGVRLLVNAAAELIPGIWLVGFDDAIAAFADPKRAFAKVPNGAFTIALFHSPSFFDEIAGRVNLALAGHTHGGQIRIPGLPPLYCPAGCGEYVEGWYTKGTARMYVSRGIGTSLVDARLFARPEVLFLTLVPR